LQLDILMVFMTLSLTTALQATVMHALRMAFNSQTMKCLFLMLRITEQFAHALEFGRDVCVVRMVKLVFQCAFACTTFMEDVCAPRQSEAKSHVKEEFVLQSPTLEAYWWLSAPGLMTVQQALDGQVMHLETREECPASMEQNLDTKGLSQKPFARGHPIGLDESGCYSFHARPLTEGVRGEEITHVSRASKIINEKGLDVPKAFTQTFPFPAVQAEAGRALTRINSAPAAMS